MKTADEKHKTLKLKIFWWTAKAVFRLVLYLFILILKTPFKALLFFFWPKKVRIGQVEKIMDVFPDRLAKFFVAKRGKDGKPDTSPSLFMRFLAWYGINAVWFEFNSNLKKEHSSLSHLDHARQLIETNLKDIEFDAKTNGAIGKPHDELFKDYTDEQFKERDLTYFKASGGHVWHVSIVRIAQVLYQLNDDDEKAILSCYRAVAGSIRRLPWIGDFLKNLMLRDDNIFHEGRFLAYFRGKATGQFFAYARRSARYALELQTCRCMETALKWNRARGLLEQAIAITPAISTERRISIAVSEAFSLANEAGGEIYTAYMAAEIGAVSPAASVPEDHNQEASTITIDEWADFYGRDIHWFHVSDDGSAFWDTTSELDDEGKHKFGCCGITEKNHVVRKGLAFFFKNFEETCKAHKDADGFWHIDQEPEFVRYGNNKEWRLFTNSIREVPGLKDFLDEFLVPKKSDVDKNGRRQNKGRYYRLNTWVPSAATGSGHAITP